MKTKQKLSPHVVQKNGPIQNLSKPVSITKCVFCKMFSNLDLTLSAIEIDPMNSDRLRGEMPNAPGAMVLTTHNIPYDYLHT